LSGIENIYTFFPVEEQYVSKFTMEPQKYEFEYEMETSRFAEIVQWIDSQSGAEKWSVNQKVFRKFVQFHGNICATSSVFSEIEKVLTVFSFSCDKATTLFKMFQT
jgi:hypothetical protein